MSGTVFNEFQLEARYWADLRTQAMIRKFGGGAPAAHLRTLTELNQRPTHRIKRTDFIMTAELFGVSDGAGLLDFLTSEEVSYLSEGADGIRADGVDRRVSVREKKREEWRDAKKGKTSDPIPMRSISEGDSDVVISDVFLQEHPHHTTPHLRSTDLKNNGQPPERIEIPPETPDDERQRLTAAIEALETPHAQDWTKSPVFIGTGRRPMKKYPTIFISPHELAQVFELYEKEGVFKKLRRSLQLVESRLKSRKSHDPPVNAHAWLMGWAFTDAVSAENETTKLKANSRRLTENVR